MKFSITVPAYKRKFLNDCIDSIIAQSYNCFELIIVDDASPEKLDEIVSLYNDNRIHYYRNEKNIGAINVVDNWNKCLEYATGEYIICMGDDDRLLPNCLEEYAKLIEKYPRLGVYHAWTEIIDENGIFVDLQEPRPEWESVYSFIWNRWNGRKQYIGDFLFDSKILKEKGGFYKLPLAWSSDDISAVIAAYGKGVANTQIPTFQYRESKYTISRTGISEKKLDAVLLSKLWYKDLLSIKPFNTMDIKFWTLLNQMFELHFYNMQRSIIKEDMKCKSVFRFVYWFRNRKRFSINAFVIKRVFLDSLVLLFK